MTNLFYGRKTLEANTLIWVDINVSKGRGKGNDHCLNSKPIGGDLEWFQGFADRALLRFFSLFFKALKIWFLFVIFLFFFFSFFEKLGKFWERERERDTANFLVAGRQQPLFIATFVTLQVVPRASPFKFIHCTSSFF